MNTKRSVTSSLMAFVSSVRVASSPISAITLGVGYAILPPGITTSEIFIGSIELKRIELITVTASIPSAGTWASDFSVLFLW